MYKKKLLYAYIFFISFPMLAMEVGPNESLSAVDSTQFKGNFSFAPTTVMAGYKQMCITPPQELTCYQQAPREIDLCYNNRYSLLSFAGDKFIQDSNGGASQSKEITKFLKILEQIAKNNPDFDHLTLTLCDRDNNVKQFSVMSNTEIFHLRVDSINQAISDFRKPIPNNFNNVPSRFDESRSRFEENDNSLISLKNVLIYMNVLQNDSFSSITFSCEKKTQTEYELASLSYTNCSLVFTLNNGIRYSCDKIGDIQEILNDLKQLFSADPEKIILVGFHDDKKLKFSDTYALSKDNFQKAITQFNTDAPKPFKKTFSSITFSCEKKTQIEYELASLSYTDCSLVFTLNNGIRYSCDKISKILKILNDLNKLLSDDPEK